MTFIAGQDLGSAVYKGPASRRRVMIAAAVMAVRKSTGVALPEDAGQALARENMTPEDLDQISQCISTSVERVLTRTGALAAEHLFDFAIAVRAQAAPRLTSALRALSQQAHLAALHDVRFDAAEFLIAAAQTCALIEAVRTRPDDSDLLGVVRRNYAQADPMGLWIAGVRRWMTAEGARGLRVHAIDPATGSWYQGGPARGAGMDPAFRPTQAYRQPIWGAGVLSDLVGTSLDMTEPLLSGGGRLSQQSVAQLASEPYLPDRLADLCHDDWRAAQSDVTGRIGTGLRATSQPVPVLLMPRSAQRPVFDDLQQQYLIGLTDRSGDTLIVTVDGAEHDRVACLLDQHWGDCLLLCEAAI